MVVCCCCKFEQINLLQNQNKELKDPKTLTETVFPLFIPQIFTAHLHTATVSVGQVT